MAGLLRFVWQFSLRLNAGSGFPTILDVWKSEGWIKPELIEDTNLDQVTLVMKMEKESDDKLAEKSAESAEKSADLKNREGMALSERHQQILAIMEAGKAMVLPFGSLASS